MSKHGPCQNCPRQAAAWLHFRDGTSVRLCPGCLDQWFDAADDQPQLEPRIWGWLAPPTALAAA